jgi:hypothetical protein
VARTPCTVTYVHHSDARDASYQANVTHIKHRPLCCCCLKMGRLDFHAFLYVAERERESRNSLSFFLRLMHVELVALSESVESEGSDFKAHDLSS